MKHNYVSYFTEMWILVSLLFHLGMGAMVANNATVWPPTLMAYSTPTKQGECSSKIFEDYKILAVGEKSECKGNEICISYSPTTILWAFPQEYNVTHEITLQAKVVNHSLIYWLS